MNCSPETFDDTLAPQIRLRYALADIDRLQASVAELTADILEDAKLRKIAYDQRDKAEADLAAAQALLLYIRNTMCKPWGDPMMQRINTALAEIKK